MQPPTSPEPFDLRRLRRALVRRFPFLHHLRRLDPRRLGPTLRDLAAIVDGVRRRRRTPGLTIAIDGNSLFEPLTGVGWYLANVLGPLAEDHQLVLRLYGPELIAGPTAARPEVALPPGVEHVIHRLSPDGLIPPHWIQKLSRPLWPALVALDRNRLLFAPNFLIRPDFRLSRQPLVATVHDLASRTVPDTLQEETRRNLELGLGATLRRAHTIVVPSEAVRHELLAAGDRAPESVIAIHHGAGHVLADQAPRRPSWAPARFALVVGTIEPRKNLGLLLDAWDLLAARRSPLPPLVIVGKLGWKSEALAERLEQGVAAGRLVRPGYLPLAELLALYRAADFVAFPTRYEGFGLPIVETFQAGTALLATDLPVVREVAGDAALLAPLDDPAAWADAAERLFDDPELRERLVAAGRARLDAFDWRRSAGLHRETFASAACRAPTPSTRTTPDHHAEPQ